MATTALDGRHRSLADFLAWELQQPERYERVNGIVRMMTGGTVAHNRITRNCARALEDRLQGSGCEVFASDMKVVSPEDDVMYPDVAIVCGEIAEQATELRTPVVVVEVLSQSTAARDHGPKRWAYQTIPSLKHYVVVDQGKPVVEVASRNDDGSWRSVIHAGSTPVCNWTFWVWRSVSRRCSPASPSRPPRRLRRLLNRANSFLEPQVRYFRRVRAQRWVRPAAEPLRT